MPRQPARPREVPHGQARLTPEPVRRALRLRVVQRLAVALLLLPLLAACAGAGEADPVASTPTAASAAPDATPVLVVPSRAGRLGDGGAAASCVETYSATTIGNRGFAFDGTVVGIAPGETNKPGNAGVDTAAVTFRVHEWFTGGTDDTVTVDMVPPANGAEQDQAPRYEPGTRLLVSGEPRWGGEPLDDPIAWTCGGFTRYYDATVADEWRLNT